MDEKQILEFIEKNPVFFLATSDGAAPFVRAVMTFRANQHGIFFCTGRNKEMARHLEQNPAVEMCYYDAERYTQVRIRGAVERLEDVELKKAVLEKFTFLRPWIEMEGMEAMRIFHLPCGTVSTWSFDKPFEQVQPAPFLVSR